MAAARDPSATPLAGPGTRRDEGPRESDVGAVERAAESILAMLERVMNGIPDVGTPIRIVSSLGEMALDVQGPVPVPGVPILLNPQSEEPSQLWQLQDTPAGEDRFVIVSRWAGMTRLPFPLVLDVRDAAPAPGAPIVLNPQSGGPSQLWLLMPAGEDGFMILASSSGLALGVQGASRDPGTPIILSLLGPMGSSLRWRLVPAPF